MPAPLEAWEALLAPVGPAHVRHANGTPVTYAARICARGVGGVRQVLKLHEIELELRDEIGNVTRRIGGADVEDIEVRENEPIIVTVACDVEPDPGPAVRTRG